MDPDISPDDVRSITVEAYIYAYPMLENYRAMVKQAIDPEAPAYSGGFNVLEHMSEPATPDTDDLIKPNNDVLPSWAWIDLRADPFVLSVPAVSQDRYYTMQVFDLYTFIAGSIGVRETGFGAGCYLIAGPDWDGQTPEGIDGVIRAETVFVTLRGRTLLASRDDIPTLEAVQSQYRLEALSQFQAHVPPSAAPDVAWLPWDDDALTTRAFIPYLSFLLQFCQPHPSEADLMRRFARIGIAPGAPVDMAGLNPAVQQAIDGGVAEGMAALDTAIASTNGVNGLAGTREALGNDYLKRAVGASINMYGMPADEAWSGVWETGSDGQPLDGRRVYRLHFAAETLPPAQFFWSATLYGLPERHLVANPIERYAIGDRTQGLHGDDAGGLTIIVSHAAPEPEEAINWLPAPAGPFIIVLRVYGPKRELLDGSWSMPPLEVMGDG